MHNTLKVTSRMWPASMLAKSRTAWLNGRMKNVESTSMMPTRGLSAIGTPGGHAIWAKYFMPWCLTPTTMNTTHTVSAKTRGAAMRALPGIWKAGMTSKMLATKMKLNSVTSRGRNGAPSLPMVGSMICFSTKPMTTSAALRTPRGT
ncbi:unannotated protein [freshwater metagenome]|uniref:Unannotated protein n=1 Tax=freshwater metagenome TaxID=449393 RepID=A0A6J6ZRS0_9ZZZZ